jgi:hypothetical protein
MPPCGLIPRSSGDPALPSRLQPPPAAERDGAYAKALPKSQQLFARARRIFPDGATHANRGIQPFPVYIEQAEGAYKWDVDGHRSIDYWMGYGALLLGHSPPRPPSGDLPHDTAGAAPCYPVTHTARRESGSRRGCR